MIRHYTEGWADGFHYNIRYWEIWNEPDNNGPWQEGFDNQMWTGTAEDYFRLYEVMSKHLKKSFPHLKIGGYASCGFYAQIPKYRARTERMPTYQYFIDFFEDFLIYVKRNECPLDFFSWHSYADVECTVAFAKYAREKLDEYGFNETETTCNEWNAEYKTRGTMHHAAVCASMLCEMQSHMPLDSAMFYDAKIGTSIYGGLFNPMTRLPLPAYYSFLAFNELYKLGNETEIILEGAPAGVSVLGATDGKQTKIIIANPTEEDVKVESGFVPVISHTVTENGLFETPFTGCVAANTVWLITV